MRKITGKLSDFSFPFPYLPNPRRSEEKKSSGNYLKVSIFFFTMISSYFIDRFMKMNNYMSFYINDNFNFFKDLRNFFKILQQPLMSLQVNHSFFCSFPYPVWVWWCRTYSYSFPQFTRVKELGDFIIFFLPSSSSLSKGNQNIHNIHDVPVMRWKWKKY